ncbi:MAG: hypothetical protein R3C11_03630 [Planctomycetaceae bacterium]
MRFSEPFGSEFQRSRKKRISEADRFANRSSPRLSADETQVLRQANAGLLWTKQFYHYVIPRWLEYTNREEIQPSSPSPGKPTGRNADWGHLYNRNIISMPDKWEYPWYAAWDLAFHLIPFAKLDPYFAKEQRFYSCGNGTCIPMASCRPMNGISAMSIRLCMPGPAGGSTR